MRDRVLFVAAAIVGLAIAPRRPWLWALAIGIWIPLHALAQKVSLGSLMMFVVLGFPLAGAYLGMGVRRAAGLATARDR